MKRTVSDREAREQLDELLDAVAKRGEEVVVERDGKPVAAIVPAAKWERLDRLNRERLWELVQQAGAGNEDMTDEEVEQLVNEEVAAVRAEQRTTAHR